MNLDFDELIRDSMTRFTDGIEMPPALVTNARSQRRHRRARIAWLASGAAVTAAAAVTIGTVATGTTAGPVGHDRSGHHRGQVQTTALVITHVERALAAAATGNPVTYTRQVNHGIKLFLVPPHGRPVRVHGSVMRTWSRGPLQRVVITTPAGKPALSTTTDNSSGKSVQTIVSYQQRVWWRATYDLPPTTKPAPGCELGAMNRTPAEWAREVRKLLSCGAAVVGRQRVDGVNAIKIKLSSSHRHACAGSSDGGRCHPQSVGWSGILWASAKTYLPLRLQSHGRKFSFQIDFRWLAPTAANLAKLHQRVPSEFRHV
jgi:hypothetical protein